MGDSVTISYFFVIVQRLNVNKNLTVADLESPFHEDLEDKIAEGRKVGLPEGHCQSRVDSQRNVLRQKRNMYVFVLFVLLLYQHQVAAQEHPECECVPFFQCRNGTIIRNGEGLLDPRSSRMRVRVRKQSPVLEEDRCNNLQVCCRLENSTEQHVHKCGRRNFERSITSRIRGKVTSTHFGEWPWQGAVVQQQDNSQFLFKCGCVLISERHALTVAHCVSEFRQKNPPLIVRLGAWDINGVDSPLPFQDMRVTQVKIHNRFNEDSLTNDIAVLKFSKPVKFSSHVDTICLPFNDESHDKETCVVTGWGKNALSGSSYSKYLRKTTVPMMNRTYCQSQLRKTRLGHRFVLQDSFVCAGGVEGEDACKGDGGGPLACYRKDNTYSLMGLVSWGIECGEAETPGVYVNVIKFLKWIRKVTKHPMEYYWPS